MSIIVKKGDITEENIDVIVNAANSRLCGGGGVDGAIHRKAGPQLVKECRKIISKIKVLETGEAVITKAYNIKNVKYIIHTVGPVWQGGNKNEDEKLKKAYENSFKLALEHNLKTIAFPAISCGVYGYPVEEAVKVVKEVCLKYDKYFEKIILVLFSDYDYNVYLKEFKDYEGINDNR